MKKITTMAYVAALALVSTAGLTSCSNDEPEGNYSGETVKTQFAITLPDEATAGIGMNRMSSTTVQATGFADFQGINGITLIPFAKQTASILGSDTRLGNNITLADPVLKAELGTNSKAKVYENVSIPLSTASFLFYGKSAQLPATPSASDKFAAGSLIPANLTANTPASITFSLEQIKSDAMSLYGSSAEADRLMTYLSSIACASDGETTPKLWYEYTAGDDAAIKAMFDTYTSMHGLSSFEVERVLTDLYVSLKPLSSPIATGIKNAIKNATYVNVEKVTDKDSVILVAALNNFPGQYNLPVGSFDMKWDGGTHKFVVGDFDNMATPDKYVFPAQLWYYANSLIKTSNTSKQTMYDNSNDWATILAAHTDAAAVNTRTRAVAIASPIQYAVARLDVAVQLATSSLVDNSETVVGIATNVTAPVGGFPVTAVLVGGQQQVKFDFTTNGGTEYTIYDNAVPAGMKANIGSLSATNYTMVLENGTGDVNIAVEMVNTTDVDFYGHGGQLIPKGGKFYVIAKLIADDATETSKHVFKQDFKTIANLTLQNLKYAYNEIPDLRTPQLELGFSVDLSWQSGHTYNIDFENDPLP